MSPILLSNYLFSKGVTYLNGKFIKAELRLPHRGHRIFALVATEFNCEVSLYQVPTLVAIKSVFCSLEQI